MAGRYKGAPCGAWARSAQRPCIRRPVLDADGRPKNGRCASHGGKSSGAKTLEGKARQLAGRIRLYNERRAQGLPCINRRPKPAPRATPAPPVVTPEERRARAIAELKRLLPEQDWS